MGRHVDGEQSKVFWLRKPLRSGYGEGEELLNKRPSRLNIWLRCDLTPTLVPSQTFSLSRRIHFGGTTREGHNWILG
jgi:hypothetical protein